METIHRERSVSRREFYLTLGGFVFGTVLGISFFSYLISDMTIPFAHKKLKDEVLMQHFSTPQATKMEMKSFTDSERMLAPTLRDVIALNETTTQIARSVLESNSSQEVKDLAQTIIENRERENKMLEGVK